MGYALNMDYREVTPSDGGGSYFPISDAKGWLCIITESDGKQTKANDGSTRLVLKLLGQEGPVQGKETEYGINIINKSQDAMRIGSQECSAIAHVTGHIKVGNSSEWHNKPFRVVVVDDSPEGSPVGTRTRINGVRDIHGNKPSQAGQGAGQTAGAFGVQGGQQNNGGFNPNAGQQQQGGGFQQQQGQQQTGFQQQGQQGGFNPNAGNGNGGQVQQGTGQAGQGFVDPQTQQQQQVHQPGNMQGQQTGQQGGFNPQNNGQQQQQGGGFNPGQQGGNFNPQGTGQQGGFVQQGQGGNQPGWGNPGQQ